MKHSTATLSWTPLFKGAWGIYKKSWSQIIGILLLAFVITLASRLFMQLPAGIMEAERGLGILLFVIFYLGLIALSVLIDVGLRRYFLGLVDGKNMTIASLFHGLDSWKHLVNYFVVSLVLGIMTFVGALLLIIPGIFLALAFMFYKYVAAENRFGFSETIRFSWNLTRGHRWKLLWIALLIVFFNILGLLFLGIGILITIPMSQIICAQIYRDLEAGMLIE